MPLQANHPRPDERGDLIVFATFSTSCWTGDQRSADLNIRGCRHATATATSGSRNAAESDRCTTATRTPCSAVAPAHCSRRSAASTAPSGTVAPASCSGNRGRRCAVGRIELIRLSRHPLTASGHFVRALQPLRLTGQCPMEGASRQVPAASDARGRGFGPGCTQRFGVGKEFTACT